MYTNCNQNVYIFLFVWYNIFISILKILPLKSAVLYGTFDVFRRVHQANMSTKCPPWFYLVDIFGKF